MVLHFTAQAVAFVIALWFGFRAARRHPDLKLESALQRSKPLVVFACVFLAIAGVASIAVFYDSVCVVFPLVVQRYISWITWGILSVLGGIVSGYASSLALARKHVQRRTLVVATILLNLATGVSSFRFLSPISDRLGEADVFDGVILQTENCTCAAATLANIAGHFGDSLNEKEAAEMLMTARLGTLPGQMRFSIDELGYGYETLDPVAIDSLSQVRAPAVLSIDHPNVGSEAYAVAYIGGGDDGFEIWDPLTGRVFWDEATTEKFWHGNGIVCSRR